MTTTYDHHHQAALAALDDALGVTSALIATRALAQAQVHATLALAASTQPFPVTLESFDDEPLDLYPASPDAEGCCAAEVHRLTVHSVLLNSISWRIADAVGDVPFGATKIEGDVEEQLGRLISEVTDRRAQAVRPSATTDAAADTGPFPSVADWDTARRLGPIFAEVRAEYTRAKAKHGDMTLDGPLATDVQRLAALMEEVGEVGRAMTYDQDHAAPLADELVQVANVALTWATYLRAGDRG